MNSFRVLVVDDGPSSITSATDWLCRGADLLPAPPEIIPAGSAAEAAAAVRHCLQSGTTIDAAIVDLGLGPRQPSGLGVIDLLEKAGIPAAIWVDWSEGCRRLMFVYAAFTWFKPVALLPKAKFYSSEDADRAARDFVRDIVRICYRQAPAPDLAAYFRPRYGRDWPFAQVLSSEADLSKWRAFLAYSQTAAIAAHLRLTPKTIDKWLADKYGPVWSLIQHASKYMDVTDARIADPPPPVPIPRSGEEKNKTHLDRKAAIHQFARSQSWFFSDPVVSARYPAR
jgi:hypothetical protein